MAENYFSRSSNASGGAGRSGHRRAGDARAARRRVPDMLDDAAVAVALEELRGLVTPDGGDVTLEGADGTTVRLQLVLETAHCVECVMPKPFLEQVALDVFRRNGAEADTVAIDDPREHPDFVAPDH
jgi:hypothetical protein